MESQLVDNNVTGELYKEYFEEMQRFGFRLCNSVSQAEDLVQNAFLKLHISEERCDKIKNVRPWLYRVIYNEFVTQNNRNYKFRQIQFETEGNLCNTFDPDIEYDSNEKKRILREEILLLKEEDKTILLLYGEGLSYKEIAEIMNIGENYVGSYICRARKRLIKQLKQKYNELFD